MGKQLTKTAFDYGAMEIDTKGKLIWLAAEIKKAQSTHAQSGLAMGKMLTEARELVGEKGFPKWAMAECGCVKQTAYNYIAAWEHFGASPTVGLIELGAMYALTKNQAAKKKALKLADKGVTVTQAMAKKLVQEAKPKPTPSHPEVDEADVVDEENADTSEAEFEEEFPEDETLENICKRETAEIESWARKLDKLTKEAQEAMQEFPTLDVLNARVGWERKLKESLATLRGTKPVLCPVCDGDNAKCVCKGHGRVTKQQHDQMV